MKLLLDTHVFLWALHESERLAPEARAMIGDLANDIYYSVATLWEISIKYHAGKLELDVPPSELRDVAPYALLPIGPEEALLAGSLPRHHRDPFDRLLVAQAMHYRLTLVTVDPCIPFYRVPVLRA